MRIDVDVLSQLMPNVLTMAAQLCATLVLFILMKKLAWGPVKKILDERSKIEQDRLDEAERLRKENEEMKEIITSRLETSKAEAQKMIDDARKEGQSIRNSLENEGKERSKQLLDEAQKDIEKQKNQMLDEVHQEIVDVAMNATEKLLGDKIDEDKDRELIEKFIEEVAKK